MSQHAKKSPICPNCDHPLNDAYQYCPGCGQENHDLHIPVKHLFLELVEGVLHFDAKFFQTAKLLLLHPGSLTEEFNAGKRTKFVPPVRMYIFISFIFFLLLSTFGGKQTDSEGEPRTGADGKDAAAALRDRLKAEKHSTIVTRDSSAVIALNANALKGSDSASVAFVMNKVDALKKDHFHGFFSRMFKSMSYMMFLLMPFAALLVSLAFGTPQRYFIDHLVFSVHYHCFAFLLLSANILVMQMLPSGWVAAATGAILFTYLFFALKTVYREKIPHTLIKMALVASAYAVVLGFAFVTSVLISVFAA